MLYQYLTDVSLFGEIDPRTADYPWVTSVTRNVALIAVYVVLVKKVGPAFMANRKPYNIEGIIRLYNVVQILLNAYLVWQVFILYIGHPNFSWTCFNVKPDSPKTSLDGLILRVSILGYYMKLFDLLDTVFFVLRKKYKQISFLHVYHHALVLFAACAYNKYTYFSHFAMVGFVNGFVHVMMYLYYLVSSLHLKTDLTPWKRRLTQLQIIQFVFFIIHFMLPIFNNWCGLKLFWVIAIQIQNVLLTIMFCNFYHETYIKKNANVVEKIK